MRISDRGLDATAAAMRRIAEKHGHGRSQLRLSSPSTTAIADSSGFIQPLVNAFGTPNAAFTLDVCGWGRAFATRYTFGIGSVGTGGWRHARHRQQRCSDRSAARRSPA